MTVEELAQRITNQFKLISVMSTTLELSINQLQHDVRMLSKTREFVQQQKQAYNRAAQGLDKFKSNISGLSNDFYSKLTEDDVESFDVIMLNANALMRTIIDWSGAVTDEDKQAKLEAFLKELQGEQPDFIPKDIRRKYENYKL